MPDDRSAITSIAHGTNPVTGLDQLVIERADGTREVHEGVWAEARALADRYGLTHRVDEPGATTWTRRPDPTTNPGGQPWT